ncbi:MAG: aminopeptidase P family protein [Saprospiraceae bacterium]|nr:aminopeptidase P family protein [Saprospiraceae bacterium]
MFNKEVYINRRNKLRSKIKNGLVLILGNPESPMNYPANVYRFRQDSDFIYFFGLDHPNFAGIMDIDESKDYIFGNDVDIDDIIWMGPQPALKDNAAEVGVTNTAPFAKLADVLKEALAKGRKIHFLPPYRAENMMLLEDLIGIKAKETKANASVELIKAVVELRSIKEECEIDHIDEIMDVAYEMHTTAMKMAQPGIYERQIAGMVEGIALAYGGTVSFPVILSKRGETLHNHCHSNLLKENDLLLVDAGFESAMRYATDHTRTCPVGGKFTQKQREIYEIVLKANNAATKAVQPGVFYKDIHMISANRIVRGLIDLGLMKGDIDEAVKAGAHAMFFPHGLGHMMGLDVHDMEGFGENYIGYNEEIKRSEQFGTAFLRLGRKLEPGFVITNEPGIYFIPALIDKWKSEKINHEFINFDKVNEYRDFGGIRLEDDILVTPYGSRIMGKRRIPVTVEEVEEIAGTGL